VSLRTEIEIAQLEFDSVRANLLDMMKDMEKVDVVGVDVSGLMGALNLMAMVDVQAGGLSGKVESKKEVSSPYSMPMPLEEIPRKIMEKNEQESRDTMKKAIGEMKAAIERKKKEFAGRARVLIEKRLDLEEIEARFHSAK